MQENQGLKYTPEDGSGIKYFTSLNPTLIPKCKYLHQLLTTRPWDLDETFNFISENPDFYNNVKINFSNTSMEVYYFFEFAKSIHALLNLKTDERTIDCEPIKQLTATISRINASCQEHNCSFLIKNLLIFYSVYTILMNAVKATLVSKEFNLSTPETHATLSPALDAIDILLSFTSKSKLMGEKKYCDHHIFLNLAKLSHTYHKLKINHPNIHSILNSKLNTWLYSKNFYFLDGHFPTPRVTGLLGRAPNDLEVISNEIAALNQELTNLINKQDEDGVKDTHIIAIFDESSDETPVIKPYLQHDSENKNQSDLLKPYLFKFKDKTQFIAWVSPSLINAGRIPKPILDFTKCLRQGDLSKALTIMTDSHLAEIIIPAFEYVDANSMFLLIFAKAIYTLLHSSDIDKRYNAINTLVDKLVLYNQLLREGIRSRCLRINSDHQITVLKDLWSKISEKELTDSNRKNILTASRVFLELHEQRSKVCEYIQEIFEQYLKLKTLCDPYTNNNHFSNKDILKTLVSTILLSALQEWCINRDFINYDNRLPDVTCLFLKTPEQLIHIKNEVMNLKEALKKHLKQPENSRSDLREYREIFQRAGNLSLTKEIRNDNSLNTNEEQKREALRKQVAAKFKTIAEFKIQTYSINKIYNVYAKDLSSSRVSFLGIENKFSILSDEQKIKQQNYSDLFLMGYLATSDEILKDLNALKEKFYTPLKEKLDAAIKNCKGAIELSFKITNQLNMIENKSSFEELEYSNTNFKSFIELTLLYKNNPYNVLDNYNSNMNTLLDTLKQSYTHLLNSLDRLKNHFGYLLKKPALNVSKKTLTDNENSFKDDKEYINIVIMHDIKMEHIHKVFFSGHRNRTCELFDKSFKRYEELLKKQEVTHLIDTIASRVKEVWKTYFSIENLPNQDKEELRELKEIFEKFNKELNIEYSNFKNEKEFNKAIIQMVNSIENFLPKTFDELSNKLNAVTDLGNQITKKSEEIKASNTEKLRTEITKIFAQINNFRINGLTVAQAIKLNVNDYLKTHTKDLTLAQENKVLEKIDPLKKQIKEYQDKAKKQYSLIAKKVLEFEGQELTNLSGTELNDLYTKLVITLETLTTYKKKVYCLYDYLYKKAIKHNDKAIDVSFALINELNRLENQPLLNPDKYKKQKRNELEALLSKSRDIHDYFDSYMEALVNSTKENYSQLLDCYTTLVKNHLNLAKALLHTKDNTIKQIEHFFNGNGEKIKQVIKKIDSKSVYDLRFKNNLTEIHIIFKLCLDKHVILLKQQEIDNIVLKATTAWSEFFTTIKNTSNRSPHQPQIEELKQIFQTFNDSLKINVSGNLTNLPSSSKNFIDEVISSRIKSMTASLRTQLSSNNLETLRNLSATISKPSNDLKGKRQEINNSNNIKSLQTIFIAALNWHYVNCEQLSLVTGEKFSQEEFLKKLPSQDNFIDKNFLTLTKVKDSPPSFYLNEDGKKQLVDAKILCKYIKQLCIAAAENYRYIYYECCENLPTFKDQIFLEKLTQQQFFIKYNKLHNDLIDSNDKDLETLATQQTFLEIIGSSRNATCVQVDDYILQLNAKNTAIEKLKQAYNIWIELYCLISIFSTKENDITNKYVPDVRQKNNILLDENDIQTKDNELNSIGEILNWEKFLSVIDQWDNNLVQSKLDYLISCISTAHARYEHHFTNHASGKIQKISTTIQSIETLNKLDIFSSETINKILEEIKNYNFSFKKSKNHSSTEKPNNNCHCENLHNGVLHRTATNEAYLIAMQNVIVTQHEEFTQYRQKLANLDDTVKKTTLILENCNLRKNIIALLNDVEQILNEDNNKETFAKYPTSKKLMEEKLQNFKQQFSNQFNTYPSEDNNETLIILKRDIIQFTDDIKNQLTCQQNLAEIKNFLTTNKALLEIVDNTFYQEANDCHQVYEEELKHTQDINTLSEQIDTLQKNLLDKKLQYERHILNCVKVSQLYTPIKTIFQIALSHELDFTNVFTNESEFDLFNNSSKTKQSDIEIMENIKDAKKFDTPEYWHCSPKEEANTLLGNLKNKADKLYQSLKSKDLDQKNNDATTAAKTMIDSILKLEKPSEDNVQEFIAAKLAAANINIQDLSQNQPPQDESVGNNSDSKGQTKLAQVSNGGLQNTSTQIINTQSRTAIIAGAPSSSQEIDSNSDSNNGLQQLSTANEPSQVNNEIQTASFASPINGKNSTPNLLDALLPSNTNPIVNKNANPNESQGQTTFNQESPKSNKNNEQLIAQESTNNLFNSLFDNLSSLDNPDNLFNETINQNTNLDQQSLKKKTTKENTRLDWDNLDNNNSWGIFDFNKIPSTNNTNANGSVDAITSNILGSNTQGSATEPDVLSKSTVPSSSTNTRGSTAESASSTLDEPIVLAPANAAQGSLNENGVNTLIPSTAPTSSPASAQKLIDEKGPNTLNTNTSTLFGSPFRGLFEATDHPSDQPLTNNPQQLPDAPLALPLVNGNRGNSVFISISHSSSSQNTVSASVEQQVKPEELEQLKNEAIGKLNSIFNDRKVTVQFSSNYLQKHTKLLNDAHTDASNEVTFSFSPNQINNSIISFQNTVKSIHEECEVIAQAEKLQNDPVYSQLNDDFKQAISAALDIKKSNTLTKNIDTIKNTLSICEVIVRAEKLQNDPVYSQLNDDFKQAISAALDIKKSNTLTKNINAIKNTLSICEVIVRAEKLQKDLAYLQHADDFEQISEAISAALNLENSDNLAETLAATHEKLSAIEASIKQEKERIATIVATNAKTDSLLNSIKEILNQLHHSFPADSKLNEEFDALYKKASSLYIKSGSSENISTEAIDNEIASIKTELNNITLRNIGKIEALITPKDNQNKIKKYLKNLNKGKQDGDNTPSLLAIKQLVLEGKKYFSHEDTNNADKKTANEQTLNRLAASIHYYSDYIPKMLEPIEKKSKEKPPIEQRLSTEEKLSIKERDLSGHQTSVNSFSKISFEDIYYDDQRTFPIFISQTYKDLSQDNLAAIYYLKEIYNCYSLLDDNQTDQGYLKNQIRNDLNFIINFSTPELQLFKVPPNKLNFSKVAIAYQELSLPLQKFLRNKQSEKSWWSSIFDPFWQWLGYSTPYAMFTILESKLNHANNALNNYLFARHNQYPSLDELVKEHNNRLEQSKNRDTFTQVNSVLNQPNSTQSTSNNESNNNSNSGPVNTNETSSTNPTDTNNKPNNNSNSNNQNNTSNQRSDQIQIENIKASVMFRAQGIKATAPANVQSRNGVNDELEALANKAQTKAGL